MVWADEGSPANINCYSSTDLENWEFENTVVDSGSMGWTGWVGRPSVIYNNTTNKYVMVLSHNGIAFLYSSTPTGNFTYERNVNSLGGEYLRGDGSLFKDPSTNIAYFTYVADDPNTIDVVNDSVNIAQLSSDYLNFSGNSPLWKCTMLTLRKEAPGIFKRNGSYYLFVSRTNGWLSSKTYYKMASTINGFSSADNWTEAGTTPNSTNSFNTQHDFVLPVWASNGSGNATYMYCGDRWNNKDIAVGGTGLYAWFPIDFDASGHPTIKGYNDWTVNTVTGQYTGIYIEENNSWRLQYTGAWGLSSCQYSSGGSITASQNTGNYMDYTFNGSWIKWYARKGAWSGKADVYIDDMNTPVATIDLYSAATEYQSVVYQNLSLSNGPHTIRIKVKGTKNQSSQGYYINIDKLEYN